MDDVLTFDYTNYLYIVLVSPSNPTFHSQLKSSLQSSYRNAKQDGLIKFPHTCACSWSVSIYPHKSFAKSTPSHATHCIKTLYNIGDP